MKNVMTVRTVARLVLTFLSLGLLIVAGFFAQKGEEALEVYFAVGALWTLLVAIVTTF